MTATIPKRARSPVIAVLVCAVAALAFDLGFNLARDSAAPVGYWLLILGATAALAAVVGGAVLLFGGGVRTALGVWVAVEIALFVEVPMPLGLLVVLAWGLLTWAALGARHASARNSVRSAPAVAMSFCVAVLVWPRFAPLVGLGDVRGWAEDLGALGVYGGTVLLLSLGSRFARRRPLLAETSTAVALALICLLAIHLAYQRSLPEQHGRPSGRRSAPQSDRPSIILLILDTVRADALTIYGSPWDTTPRLRRFLERSGRAAVYPWAFAPSNWTVPSHASLLTGLLPSQHGAHSGTVERARTPFRTYTMRAETTLAEVLRGRGYRTALITANPNLLRIRGLERGFDRFLQPPSPRPSSLLVERLRRGLTPSLLAGAVGETPKAGQVGSALLDFLRGCRPDPCFVVANFMEPHTPYTPPWTHTGVFTETRMLSGPEEALADGPPGFVELAYKRYLEEIRVLDGQLGALLDQLEMEGFLDSSWLAITSDHGEGFREHGGTNHASNLYNEQIRVPLVIQPPRGETLPVKGGAVGLLDLAATLAAVGGVPGFGHGRNLAAGPLDDEPVSIQFYGRHWREQQRYGPHAREPASAVVLGRHKLISRSGREELYDLAVDPEEKTDRAQANTELVELLRGALPPLTLEPAGEPAREEELSPEMREALRALGYLD